MAERKKKLSGIIIFQFFAIPLCRALRESVKHEILITQQIVKPLKSAVGLIPRRHMRFLAGAVQFGSGGNTDGTCAGSYSRLGWRSLLQLRENFLNAFCIIFVFGRRIRDESFISLNRLGSPP